MGDDEVWSENPLYESAQWQENALYEPAEQEDPDAALEGISRLFPSDARIALDAQLHARQYQELKPIDTDNPMEDPDAMKGYVSSTLGVREQWDGLDDAKRREKINAAAGRAAGEVHDGLSVEYVTKSDRPGMELTAGTAGMTDPWSGQVISDPTGFSGDQLTADTVDTVYHETTHAEQVQLVRDVKVQGGPITDREVDINYEMNVNLGTSIVNPEPDTTLWVEQHSEDGDAGYAAYRGLRAEQEAHAAGEAAGRMFSRVSDVHDELREHFEAKQRAQDFAELPQIDPTDDEG